MGRGALAGWLVHGGGGCLTHHVIASIDSLLHDLGIGAIGCCYDGEGELSIERLEPFLRAYHAVRPLCAAERGLLHRSMRGAALAVAFFRWRQFNVRHPELADARDAYRAAPPPRCHPPLIPPNSTESELLRPWATFGVCMMMMGW
jgi:hypothetical protein